MSKEVFHAKVQWKRRFWKAGLAAAPAAVGLAALWLLFGRDAPSLARLRARGYGTTMESFQALHPSGSTEALPWLKAACRPLPSALGLRWTGSLADSRTFLAWLKAHPAAESSLRKASESDVLYRPPGAGSSIRKGDVRWASLAKQGVSLLCMEAESQAQAGNAKSSLESIQRAARLARLAGGPPTIFAALVQASATGLVARAACRTASRFPDDEGLLTDLRTAVQTCSMDLDCSRRLQGSLPDYVGNIDGLIAAEVLSRASQGVGRHGTGGPINSQPDSGSFLPRLPGATPMLEQCLVELLKVDDLARDKTKTLLQKNVILDGLDKRTECAPGWNKTVLRDYGVPGRNLFLPYLRSLSAVRLTEGFMAVLQFRSRTGRLPSSLAEADAGFIDPMLVRPLRYRREGRGFRLWASGRPAQDLKGTACFEAPAKGGKWDRVVLFPWHEGITKL